MEYFFCKRMCTALMIFSLMLWIHAVYADTQQKITTSGVRAVLGPYAAAVAETETAPRVDGEIFDEVWQDIEPFILDGVDEQIPRLPRQQTKIRAAECGDTLYMAFRCRDFRQTPHGARNNDDASFLRGDYAGIILDLGEQEKKRYHAILLSPSGAVFTAARGVNDPEWDVSWNPEGVQAETSRYVERWTAELAVPLKGRLANLPGIADATIVRNRFHISSRNKPSPKAVYYDSVQALCHLVPSRGNRGGAQLVRAVADMNPGFFLQAERPFFGKLVFEARLKESGQRERIIAESKKTAAEKKRLSAELPAGFEFSAQELRELYGRPCLFVPVVKRAPVIDGDDSDPVWKNPRPILLDCLIYDVEGPDANNPTVIRMVSDREFLYLLAVMGEEDVSKIEYRSSVSMWRHDILELLVDMGLCMDYSAYYHIQSDAKAKCGFTKGRHDNRWKPETLKASAKIHKDRWVIEVKVAFRDFGVDLQAFPKVWGANFGRTRWVNRPPFTDSYWEQWDSVWVPNSHSILHAPTRWGLLYMQAGNALPPELIDYLRSKGRDTSGLKTYRRPDIPPKVEPPKLSRAAAFAHKPRVRVENGKAYISFAAAEPVDAAVTVLNEKGNPVRHLAAGMLGPNPPSPFKTETLKQELIWDFRDDLGKEVPEGKYTAHVGLGLAPAFDRTVFWSPYKLQRINGIACDGKGRLCVLEFYDYGHWLKGSTIRMYGRDGSYIRMLYPFPGKQPAEKVEGARPIRYSDGSWTSTTYHGMSHSRLPWLDLIHPQTPVVDPRGRLIFANAGGRQLRTCKRLLALGTDGSVPADFAGPVITSEDVRGRPAVACSPDGTFFYVTHLRGYNVWAPKGGEHHHVVYRFRWNSPPPHPSELCAQPFIGKLWQRGNGKTLLNDPRDVAAGPKGNIYVADTGNGRIAVFSPEGSWVKDFKLKGVTAVEVDPESGLIYAKAGSRLKKLSAETGALVCEHAAKGDMLALDSSGKEARVWVAHSGGIRMFTDRGNRFEAGQGDPIASRIGRDGRYPGKGIANFEFSHNPANQHLFLGTVYSGSTGRPVPGVPTVKGKAAVGPDGYIYVFSRSPRPSGKGKNRCDFAVRRFTPDMKPAKFEGTGKHLINVPTTRSGNQANPSFAVSRKGQIVIMDINRIGQISVFGLDGKLIRKGVVKGLYTQGFHIIRSDSRGAFYLGSSVWHPDELIPAEAEGRLPWVFRSWHGKKGGIPYCVPGFEAKPRWHYEHFIGSVTKFGPEGGLVKRNAGKDLVLGSNHGGYNWGTIQGLKWLRNGFCPHMYRETENANCNCEQGNFDLDTHDRIYIPDAFLGHVQVVDRNNNLITRIGRYGNADEGGSGTDIAFAWPTCVSAGERYVYVSDRLLRKLTRVKLVYMEQAEAGFVSMQK